MTETCAIDVDSAHQGTADHDHDHDQQFFDAPLVGRYKDIELVKLLHSSFKATHESINFNTSSLNLSHHKFSDDSAPLFSNNLKLGRNLQPYQTRLARKLHLVKIWTKILPLIFIVVAVTISVAGAVTARKPAAAAAVAAAGPIVVGAIGTWTVSRLKKYKSGLEKENEMIEAMDSASKSTINNLSKLYFWDSAYEMNLQEMAEAGEVKKKVVSLTVSLKGVKLHAAKFSRDARLARETLYDIVHKHLDYIQI